MRTEMLIGLDTCVWGLCAPVYDVVCVCALAAVRGVCMHLFLEWCAPVCGGCVCVCVDVHVLPPTHHSPPRPLGPCEERKQAQRPMARDGSGSFALQLAHRTPESIALHCLVRPPCISRYTTYVSSCCHRIRYLACTCHALQKLIIKDMNSSCAARTNHM